MPSSPGSRLDIMQLQAGTVMGGTTLLSLPQQPCSVRRLSVGSSSRQRSKASSGGTQSNPMTATLRCFAIAGTTLTPCHSERSEESAFRKHTAQEHADPSPCGLGMTLGGSWAPALQLVPLGGGGEDARNLRPGKLIRQALAADEHLAHLGSAEGEAVRVGVPAGFLADDVADRKST